MTRSPPGPRPLSPHRREMLSPGGLVIAARFRRGFGAGVLRKGAGLHRGFAVRLAGDRSRELRPVPVAVGCHMMSALSCRREPFWEGPMGADLSDEAFLARF